jgi:aryl-alcohol dehydrogenase (NADP+)
MHRPDPWTSIEESLAAMQELVDEGKVVAIGTSTFSAEQLDAARRRTESAGATPPATEQPPYSILTRGVERDVLPWCAAHDVGAIAWAPLNGGWLTGKYQSGAAGTDARYGVHCAPRRASASQWTPYPAAVTVSRPRASTAATS